MAGVSGLTIASYALTAASAGLAAYSSYKGGKAQERAYNAQAAQDEANARQKALETSLNEDTARKQQRAKLAKMSAAQSEAGLSGGTAETSYMASVRESEQDVMNLRYQGMSQWANYKNQAALNRMYGHQAFKQGQMGAWTAGLGGLAKLGSMYAANYTPNLNEPQFTNFGSTGKTLATASNSELQGMFAREKAFWTNGFKG